MAKIKLTNKNNNIKAPTTLKVKNVKKHRSYLKISIALNILLLSYIILTTV